MVLFDINRRYKEYIKLGDVEELLENTKKRTGFKPRLTLVTSDGKSTGAKLETYFGQKEEPWKGELKWPDKPQVLALSHVCIPISRDDEHYGDDSLLGGLNIKGEKDTFDIPPALLMELMRIRYNPFFPFVKARIEKVIS